MCCAGANQETRTEIAATPVKHIGCWSVLLSGACFYRYFLEPCWGAQMSSRKSPFSTPLLYLSFRTGISLIKRRHDFSLRGGFWVGFKPGFEPVQTRVQSDSNLGSNLGLTGKLSFRFPCIGPLYRASYQETRCWNVRQQPKLLHPLHACDFCCDAFSTTSRCCSIVS